MMMMAGGLAVDLNHMVCSSRGLVISNRASLCKGHYRPMKKRHEAKEHGQDRPNDNIG